MGLVTVTLDEGVTATLIEREKLEVTDHVFEYDNRREIASEYRFDGKLVRRSVWVDGFNAGLSMGVAGGK